MVVSGVYVSACECVCVSVSMSWAWVGCELSVNKYKIRNY